jgi:hypothetical protein
MQARSSIVGATLVVAQEPAPMQARSSMVGATLVVALVNVIAPVM